MTRQTIRDTSRQILGETTAVFWSDDILNTWAESAQLDIGWKARVNVQRSLATPIADTVRYTLSTLVPGILRIITVRAYNSSTTKWNKLELKEKTWLDEYYPEWSSADTSEPMFYTYDTDLDEFILYPSANSDYVGTDYLEIYNSSRPDTMGSDSASPDLPLVLHPAVISYMVATALESRGYQDIAQANWQKYFGQIKSYMVEKNFESDEEIIMVPQR